MSDGIDIATSLPFDEEFCDSRTCDEYLVRINAMNGPKFMKPPVVERVLSVQFQELYPFDIVHFGLWYNLIRGEYPDFERQNPLERIDEPFPFVARQPRHRFGLELIPPLPRMVFSRKGSTNELLQLQSNRLIMNWGHSADGSVYIDFEQISEQFSRWFEMLVLFCTEHSIDKPIVDLCEVTYVNHINPTPQRTVMEYFSDVFISVNPTTPVEWMSAPKALTYNRVFDITDDQGRLYFEAGAPVVEQDAILLKVTGRAIVEPEQSWLERLKSAHDWVVNGFEAVTSEAVRQQVWEQHQ